MQPAVAGPPEQLQRALILLLARYDTREQRIEAARKALEGPFGRVWRGQLGNWAAWLVPVEELVPEAYRHWRPLVRDSMRFVVSRLSPARLAPKVVEQIELPEELPPEQRLLHLIAKVPGLQKIGQVLARNRHFEPRFRRALAKLENGISDVTAEEVRAVLLRELGPRLDRYSVRLDARILSEASVSAVMGFRWQNPATGRRERGVFKVLKPHIPECYTEDMRILQQLAGFLARKYFHDRARFAGLAETLTEIRLLLEREVDFRREQRTLAVARRVYGRKAGVRVPGWIEPLSTDSVTALSYEPGVKVTRASGLRAVPRERLADRLAETLVAVPAFYRRPDVLFHADPHAGNLLYDRRRNELVILDWALTECLTGEQRRLLLLLALMATMRDPDGLCRAIGRLRAPRRPGGERVIRQCVDRFLESLPPWRLPGAMDALKLLDEVAREGIRFPAPLVMFRKAVFTLEGVLEDVAGSSVGIGPVLARYALRHWANTGLALWSLLSLRDWLALEWSALTFGLRLTRQALDSFIGRAGLQPAPGLSPAGRD